MDLVIKLVWFTAGLLSLMTLCTLTFYVLWIIAQFWKILRRKA